MTPFFSLYVQKYFEGKSQELRDGSRFPLNVSTSNVDCHLMFYDILLKLGNRLADIWSYVGWQSYCSSVAPWPGGGAGGDHGPPIVK
jgi:hypothetical protein